VQGMDVVTALFFTMAGCSLMR